MTRAEAKAVQVVLRALANHDASSWDELEMAGELLADAATVAWPKGWDGHRFLLALAAGQGVTEDQILDVQCPVRLCGAPEGMHCGDKQGNVLPIHRQRIRRAIAEALG